MDYSPYTCPTRPNMSTCPTAPAAPTDRTRQLPRGRERTTPLRIARCSDMTATELLADLQRQGFSLTPLPGGYLKVRPASRLTAGLCAVIRRRKAEILAVLSCPPGLALADVSAVFPGARDLTPAVAWLRQHLAAGPQRIAPLLAEWLGTVDTPTGRNLDDLMDARFVLGISAHLGTDNRMWWRLPQPTLQ